MHFIYIMLLNNDFILLKIIFFILYNYEYLSFNDEYMDEEKTIENKDKKRDSEYEDIKNSINNLIPSVIDEIKYEY